MKHIPFYRIAKLLFDEPAVVKETAEVLRAVLRDPVGAVDGDCGEDEGK